MLSVIVITKNEAHNIARCLESVCWADELIVLDSGSTDDTVTIAKGYTPHVHYAPWEGYGVQKQRALQAATGDWVLNLDADEFVTQSLKQAMQAAMASNHWDACRIPIRMCFGQKTLNYSSSPTRHARLFKREGAAFSADVVHEKIILPQGARIGQLRTPILHYSYVDVSHALDKLNRYSSYSASIRLGHQKKSGLLQAIVSSMWMFVRCYFLQRGFLDGREGFLFAVLSAQGSFFRKIKQLYPDKA